MRRPSLLPVVRSAACLAAVLLLAPAAGGQEVPEASFGESVAVDLMTVEVLVMDRRGDVVRDLGRADFRLFENGRPVELTHFESPPAAAAGIVATGEGDAAAPAPPVAESPGHFVVVVDNLHMGLVNRHALFTELYRALDAALRPGDRVMVVDYDGGTRVALPFTDSRRDLIAALESQREGEARYAAWELERRRMLDTLERMHQIEKRGEGGDLASAGCISVGLMAWDYARAQHSEVQQTIRALRNLVGTLAGVPGRKSLVYVSDGVPMSPGAVEVQYATDMCDGTAAREGIDHATKPMDSTTAKDTYWDPSHSRLEIVSLDTSNEWYLLAAQATAHRVAFYPIQSSGLAGGGFTSPINTSVRTTTLVQTMARRDPQDTLVLLASETGGSAILHAGDVGSALGDALQAAQETYVLGFTPVRGGEERRNSLRVEVARPGVELRYPRSYYRKSAHGQMADAVVSSLLHGVEANPLGIQVTLVEQAPGGGKDRLRVSLPLAGATLLPAGEESQGLVTLFVAMRPTEGASSEVRQTTVPVRVPGASAATGSFVHDIGLALGPGRHQIAVGVYDEIGGVLSYVRREVAIGGEARAIHPRG